MPKNKTRTENTPEETFSLISNEKLLAIYSAMLKCRLLGQRAASLFQHGKLDTDLDGSAGLEATAVAVVIDLQQADSLCLAPNDWLPAFVKGMSVETLFRALAPSSPQVGGTAQIEAEHKNIFFPSTKADPQRFILDRASDALVARNGAVAAAFIPSDAGSLTEWQKTIHTAGTKKVPIIFVHYSAPDDASSSSRPEKPEALVHGIPSIAVDARDPVAVYRVAYEAIVRARQLRGATLLECIIDSQPSSPDTGDGPPADPISTDSIAAMEAYLKGKKIDYEARNRQMIEAFSRDLDLATRFLKASSKNNIFAHPTDPIRPDGVVGNSDQPE